MFKLSSSVALAAILVGNAFAQQPLREMAPEEPLASQLARKPTVGALGIRETMAQIVQRQNRALPDTPRWMFGPQIKKSGSEMWYESSPSPMDGMSGWPNSSTPFEVPEPRITIGDTWVGPDSSVSGFFPPDTHGAVGLTQVMIVVNGRCRIYNKTGAQQFDVTGNTFFASVRGTTNAVDPRVIYDPLTDRWFVCAINTGASNRVLLAVSSGGTITNTSSFTFFQFAQDGVGTPGTDAGQFFDYPCMGVDNNAVYIGGNVFGAGTPTAFVIRKSSVLGAGPLVVKDFRNIGSFSTPYGVTNTDPAATQGYFMGVPSDNTVGFRRISDPGGNPTMGPLVTVTVPTTAAPVNFAPQGSTSPVDSIDRRFFSAQIRLNRITGVRSLWASHNSRVTNAGVGSTAGDRLGGRWYQISNMTSTPTLTQAGTLFSPNGTPRHFNMSSIAMNGQGHATVASSTYGADLFASVGGSFRLRTDPLGLLESPSVLQSSSTAYNAGFQSTRYRWGDYSHTVVDPADDMTFWTFQEYCSNTNAWAVRAIEVRPPAPAAVTTLSPNTIDQGATANIVVTGTSTAGTEFFDPGAGFTNRLQAAFSGTGLTVNSVTFTNPTSFTMNVTATGGATLGARNLTVTNPDGQTSVGNGVLSVVSAGNPAPSVTSMSPISKVTLSPSFTLTVNGSNFVTTSKVQWNGSDRSTVFVNSGQLTATINASDLLTQGNFPVQVVTPAPGGGTSSSLNFLVERTNLSQSVTLLNHSAPGSQPVTVEIRNVGSITPLQTFNQTLSGGTYSFLLDIAPGSYDVAVKGATWLRDTTSPVNFNSALVAAPGATLTNGDVNGDNLVDIADYALLSEAFDATPSDPGWLASADLNGDLIVDIGDYAILAGSFDLAGNP